MTLTRLVVTLAVIGRLFMGPAFAEADAEGRVPICAGGQIVWVDLDLGDEAPERADPCPYLGLAADPVLPGAALIAPQAVGHRLALPQRAAAQIVAARRGPYLSRAPPVPAI